MSVTTQSDALSW